MRENEMRSISKIICSFTLVTFVFAGHAFAEMHLMDAWAYPTTQSSKNVAAYLKMHNHGDLDDVLLDVRADVSKKIELHTTNNVGNPVGIRPVNGGIQVKSGELIELAPGGYRIMMISVQKKLTAGDSFPLTLVFKRGGEVRIDVEVKNYAANDDHSQHKN